MERKIGVTLASSRLAKAIIEELLKTEKANNIVLFSRDIAKAQYPEIETRKGDYDNPEDWDNSLADVETLILISSISEPDRRLIQHRTVIDAAKKQGVKKLIYTSIIGSPDETTFAPVVESNRLTEKDVIESGITYIIGRNSLYLDSDIDSIESYRKAGGIYNSAENGKCCYITRQELGQAYAIFAHSHKNDNKIFNLCGLPYTQQEVADAINKVCHLDLVYKSISSEEFHEQMIKNFGEFYGNLVAGIYDSIAKGFFDVTSDYKEATNIDPLPLVDMIKNALTTAKA